MKAEEIIELAMKGEVLKKLDRAGWILAKVDQSRVESVAEHSFGTTLISLLLAEHQKQEGVEIDLGRTLSMAIIHDLAESEISDIVIYREAPDRKEQLREKAHVEGQAMSKLLSSLSNEGRSLHNLWDELQNQSTLEARVVISSDIIDMLIHAVSMERSGVAPNLLTGFFESSRQRLETLDITLAFEIYKALVREHKVHLKNEA
jgi:putative hydrolase of HD superfamily